MSQRSGVRLHFRKKPWDVVAVVGYTLVMTAVLLALGNGHILAILLVLFVPGYVFVASLFPNDTEIDWTERVALSVGLSITVVPLLGFILNFTPWGIRYEPIVATITIALFTVGVGYAAYWRRMRLPVDQRLSLTVELALPAWRAYSAMDKALAVALVAGIAVAAGTLVYVATTPRAGERFTEFYLLGPGGNTSGYPMNLTPAEPGTVVVGIINHEAAAAAYAVRVDLVGVDVVFNASCNCNQTQELNRTSISWLNQSLGDAQNWTQRYTFWINATGLWKIQFLLYKDGDFSSAYRELHLFIRVG